MKKKLRNWRKSPSLLNIGIYIFFKKQKKLRKNDLENRPSLNLFDTVNIMMTQWRFCLGRAFITSNLRHPSANKFDKPWTSVASNFSAPLKIQSWPDLYLMWETSVALCEESSNLFKPIFDVIPPTSARGATERQLRLYRGHSTHLEEPKYTGPKQLTYRGHKQLSTVAEETPNTCPDAPKAKARYYRGARIN